MPLRCHVEGLEVDELSAGIAGMNIMTEGSTDGRMIHDLDI